MIDRLRNELKERDKLNLEIIEIKKDVNEIKLMLNEYIRRLDESATGSRSRKTTDYYGI